MKDLPSQQLDARVKNVWRITDMITILVNAVVVVGLLQLLRLDRGLVSLANMLTVAALVLVAIALVVFLVVLPPIRYARWRYEMSPTYLDIAKGIFWRKRYIVPFIRVQNTDTRQGPVLRAFGLASVTVSTAAHEHVIPGLDVEVAEQLRDQAAELARLAREDV